MADEKKFSVEEAAKELRTGVSTLLLWQHIYSEFLNSPGEEGEQILNREDIRLFTYISECTESGLTREEIRQALRNRATGRGPLFPRNAFQKDDDEEILSLLDEENPTPALLAHLVIQQRRLATAEERKASAQERRLAIEEEKSQTLSAILTALATTGLPAIHQQQPPPRPVPTPAPEAEPEQSVEARPPEPLQAELPPTDPMDDLNALINDAPSTEEPLDDLWLLVNQSDPEAADPMDNLWDLVDSPEEKEALDDLWLLVDKRAGETPGEEAMDNLWDLVDEAPPAPHKKPMSDTGLDDLWTDTDEPDTPTEPEAEMDNLWELVDVRPTEKAKKPTRQKPAAAKKGPTPPPAGKTPPGYPTDPADYKDYILKEIIGMKRREGLSSSQVADRLNAEARPTFSGKGTWGTRTIEGIFRIIEKAGPGQP